MKRSMAATKGIRLNPILREEFEQFCRAHLLDERAVIEAWLLRFLEAPDDERQQVAKRYMKWHEERTGEKAAVRPDTLTRKGQVSRTSRRRHSEG